MDAIKKDNELEISRLAENVSMNHIGLVRNNLPWKPLKHQQTNVEEIHLK